MTNITTPPGRVYFDHEAQRPQMQDSISAKDFIHFASYANELLPWQRDLLDTLVKLQNNRIDMRLTTLVPKGPAPMELKSGSARFMTAAGNHGVMIIVDDPVRPADQQPSRMHRIVAPPAMGKTTQKVAFIDAGDVGARMALAAYEFHQQHGYDREMPVSDLEGELLDMYGKARPQMRDIDLTLISDEHLARLRMMAERPNKLPDHPPGIAPETNRASRRKGGRTKPRQHLKGLR